MVIIKGKEVMRLKFRLICDGDPKTLGIEDAEGNWDLRKFKNHVKTCAQCGEFSVRILENIKSKFLRGEKNKLIENNEFDNFISTLEMASRVVEQRRPEASPQKKAAFANSVAYLVTGWSGGYGGPSAREHTVGRKYNLAGRYNFEEVCELLLKDDGLIFGPITDLHRQCWREELCFDDDPADLIELKG